MNVTSPAVHKAVYPAVYDATRGPYYSAYAVNNSDDPPIVVDYSSVKGAHGTGYFRKAGSQVAHDSLVTFARAGNATVIDSDGLLKWAAHNFFLNSAIGATQGVTTIAVQHTIAFKGTGTITLSGTSTDGPLVGTGADDLVELDITPTAGTLTCTVSGSCTDVRVYRSSLDGMQANPDATTDTSLVTTAGSIVYKRRNIHFYEGALQPTPRCMVEETATNLFLNSETLSTQNVTTTAVAHTISFTGTGTITLSGTSTDGPLVGTGTGEENRVSLTFTPSAGTLTCTVSGTVTNAQCEVGSIYTSYIPTAASPVTRAAETMQIDWENLASIVNTTAMCIAVKGDMNYADDGSAVDIIWWYNFGDSIKMYVATNGANIGRAYGYQSDGGTADFIYTAADHYTPGSSVAFNMASRHTSSAVNLANEGTALTADTTPTGLPDLSAIDLNILNVGNGNIEHILLWGAPTGMDIYDDGIDEATS
ncbi:MAG: hypothetical protein GY943_30325 [Chloroflexi bacterium]|nr:hypothetical protein [Chloroflexota bacterium]